MRIHLVTYATPRFRLRQLILGWSARFNGVVDTVTHWTPKMLLQAGFEERCKGIKLCERGSGFWAWKPFIIDAKLREVPDGDLVFYCDVGRVYPIKLIDQPLNPYLEWMQTSGQDVMPGIEIPWDGPNSTWTKREALIFMGMDFPQVHMASPTQASFSIWLAGNHSRSFAATWLDLCSQRNLISDDPSNNELTTLPDFRAHRHDQALLSLCCIAYRIKGINIGNSKPNIDVRNPSSISRSYLREIAGYPTTRGKLIRAIALVIEKIERKIRIKLKFGEPINE